MTIDQISATSMKPNVSTHNYIDNRINNRIMLKDLAMLTVFTGIVYGLLAWYRPLFTPDEGRYAEICREMAMNGDFITPFLNGVYYFEKPPFFYWLGALSIKLFGVHIWSVRLISATFAVLGSLLTYCFACATWNRTVAWMAALIQSSSWLYFVMAYTINLDMTVTFWLTATLYALVMGVKQQLKPSDFWMVIAAIAAAFAVLSKGIIGIVLPGAFVVTLAIVERRLDILSACLRPRCLLVFLAIVLPWHIAVALKHDYFLNFYIMDQHILRYSQRGVGHDEPWWFFAAWFLLGFMPWSYGLLNESRIWIKNSIGAKLTSFSLKRSEIIFGWMRGSRFRRSRHPSPRGTPATRFRNLEPLIHPNIISDASAWRNTVRTALLLWASIVFVFFSLSTTKLIPYILPMIAPCSILVAQSREWLRGNGFAWCYGLFLLLVTGVLLTYLYKVALPDTLNASIFLSIGLALLWASLIVLLCIREHMSHFVLIVFLAMCHILFGLMVIAATPSIDKRSILKLAQTLSAMRKHDPVVNYHAYDQDLPFYLQSRVTIVNWQNELTFGMQHQDTSSWMISDETFWENTNRYPYIIMSLNTYRKEQDQFHRAGYRLLDETLQNVLLTNRK